jgi:hypothetical protein
MAGVNLRIRLCSDSGVLMQTESVGSGMLKIDFNRKGIEDRAKIMVLPGQVVLSSSQKKRNCTKASATPSYFFFHIQQTM